MACHRERMRDGERGEGGVSQGLMVDSPHPAGLTALILRRDGLILNLFLILKRTFSTR